MQIETRQIGKSLLAEVKINDEVKRIRVLMEYPSYSDLYEMLCNGLGYAMEYRVQTEQIFVWLEREMDGEVEVLDARNLPHNFLLWLVDLAQTEHLEEMGDE
jgi:hypothetical protein